MPLTKKGKKIKKEMKEEYGAKKPAQRDPIFAAWLAEVEANHGAGSLRRRRRVEGDLLPVQNDVAGIFGIGARQDLDEGRLAGAIVADHRVHLTASDVAIDACERLHAGETLGDAPHLE